jgi:hypothetical protein
MSINRISISTTPSSNTSDIEKGFTINNKYYQEKKVLEKVSKDETEYLNHSIQIVFKNTGLKQYEYLLVPTYGSYVSISIQSVNLTLKAEILNKNVDLLENPHTSNFSFWDGLKVTKPLLVRLFFEVINVESVSSFSINILEKTH